MVVEYETYCPVDFKHRIYDSTGRTFLTIVYQDITTDFIEYGFRVYERGSLVTGSKFYREKSGIHETLEVATENYAKTLKYN